MIDKEAVLAEAREHSARKVFREITKENRPDIVVAIILRAIDGWYETGFIRGGVLGRETIDEVLADMREELDCNRYILRTVVKALPEQREWLDPGLERAMREATRQ